MAKIKRYLILPRTSVSLRNKKLFYLAGPVEGGGNWQKKAIVVLRKKFPDAYFAFNCPFDRMRRLRRFAVRGDEAQYSNETEWQREHMEFAAKHGCLVFWLGPQDKEEDVDFSKVPYGLEASREEAEWAFRLFCNKKLRVVIGTHHSFPGQGRIMENLLVLFGINVPLHGRLQDVLDATIKMAK